MLIWGKIRYDLVAFSALVIAVIAGVIPENMAFDGFAHHATIIIALVSGILFEKIKFMKLLQ